MSLASDVIARRLRLPRAQTLDVVCERDLATAMDDGTVLLADRWVARARRDGPAPTVLVRSPYGRRQFVGLLFGRLLAERGLQVLVQSVRGTFGSEGTFSPFDERADGLATLRWLRSQAWHDGGVGMIGAELSRPRAVGRGARGRRRPGGARDPGERLAVPRADVRGREPVARDRSVVARARRGAGAAARAARDGARAAAPARRPRAAPDRRARRRATGAEVAWFREGLASPGREDAYWVARDFAAGVADVAAPVQLVGGWHDIFLPWMLEDFIALRAAGRSPQLVIGPWTHVAPGLLAAGLKEGLALAARAPVGRPSDARRRAGARLRDRRASGRRLARAARLASARHRRAAPVARIERAPARRAARRAAGARGRLHV